MLPKKIAIYSGEIPSTTFIERLIEGLANNGCQIFLFGWQKKKIFYTKNVSNFSYTSKWNKLYILLKYSFLLAIFMPKEKRKLDKIISDKKRYTSLDKVKYYPVLYHKPDIFHLQWAKSLEDWIWVQEFGMKLIVSLRGAHINYSPIADKKLAEVYKKYFPFVNGFHAVSNEIKKETLKYNANFEKIKVVYSGLDIEKLRYQQKAMTQGSVNILSIGRNHWKKGYNYALDAFRLLSNESFDFNYKIIGINKDAEELIFQQSQLKLEERVEFISHLPFEKVMDNIVNADILLLPSLEEGIANVVLEAMALGTLVLTTNCGGMSEVVLDGENGFIVPVRNPKAIAEKIKKIVTLTESEKNEIRKKARTTIEKQHDFDENCNAMQTLYQSVLTTN